MNPQELYKAPQIPGIYYFYNTKSDKYYIGQAKKSLRRRLLYHKGNFENDRYDAPIYRALKKYGWDAFEWGILNEFEPDIENLFDILDELEIKYIADFNSYGPTGYNQTRGGDGGILGYKFTEEQKEKLRNNTKMIIRYTPQS